MPIEDVGAEHEMTPIFDSKLFEVLAAQTQDYAIFLLDRDGYILTWNAGARLIKHYEASDVIGRHFSAFYTPEDIARNWPAEELQQAMNHGRFEDEGWRVKKDGSRFWANVVITALRDDNGQFLAFAKITRDLSERKKQEESLRQSEERFRLLIDGVADYAIYMLNPEGIVTSWNVGARRIKGYEASEIIGTHFAHFYDAEGIEAGKPWAELATAREHGRAEDEGWRVRKDGSRFWARVVVTALHDADGRLRGFAKVTQDLTLKRHSEMLEEAAQNINEFIAVLAHELRNPLAPIRTAVHLMAVARRNDAVHDKARQIIDRQSAQMVRIVDDLLDVSRLTRGSLSVNRRRIPVADIVSRALEAASPGIEAGRHVLDLELPAAPIFVLADELRMTQALSNILNNAARYTEKGGRITVKVDAAEGAAGGPVARISVRDTGQGIAPALIDSIFGMFVQGKHPLGRATMGLGIGLALARSIVELHHGTIEVRSEGIGRGSEFVIAIPVAAAAAATATNATATADADATAPAPSVPSVSSTPADPPHAALRILVVDDNEDAALMLASLLENRGHEVLSVHDGHAAVAAFEQLRPDVVLLDIGMPGMNGLEVARRLRQANQEPRPLIVAVTGWGTAEDRLQSKEAGFDVHLVKPVVEDQLLRLLADTSTRH